MVDSQSIFDTHLHSAGCCASGTHGSRAHIDKRGGSWEERSATGDEIDVCDMPFYRIYLHVLFTTIINKNIQEVQFDSVLHTIPSAWRYGQSELRQP
jgi:hypothetical protein